MSGAALFWGGVGAGVRPSPVLAPVRRRTNKTVVQSADRRRIALSTPLLPPRAGRRASRARRTSRATSSRCVRAPRARLLVRAHSAQRPSTCPPDAPPLPRCSRVSSPTQTQAFTLVVPLPVSLALVARVVRAMLLVGQVTRDVGGGYLAISSRGNFYMTWSPGQVRSCSLVERRPSVDRAATRRPTAALHLRERDAHRARATSLGSRVEPCVVRRPPPPPAKLQGLLGAAQPRHAAADPEHGLRQR